MMTLRQFSAEPSTIPTITNWYLADLSKAQGKQELFTHQLRQKLKILREHALIESAISSAVGFSRRVFHHLEAGAKFLFQLCSN